MVTTNEPPDLPPPEEVIANRSGDVLIKHTTLKADHFPSCHNTKLTPILEGAPNFRQIPGLPVYGVAIPTVTGLRSVLNALGADKGRRKVYWQNLREEPLIFINGNPFVVREADQPFCNLEYTGIDRSRVEDMEARLKADILREALAFNNVILVKHENEDLSLFDHWEPVTASDVQTPCEVYAELRADGYDIDYLRIPVTDEKAPKDQDFDVLIKRMWSNLGTAAFVFNCQMGRGRTTTGTIIGALLYLRKLGAFPAALRSNTTTFMVPTWFSRALADVRPVGEQTKDKLRHGMYDVVRSLLRVLENGPGGKAVLDAVVDAASQMQNLREAIGSYRQRFLKEMRERQRANIMSVALEYLERYYMLIAFASYLYSPSFNPDLPQQATFSDWMASRPELRSVLMRLLRRNPLAALDLHVPASSPEAAVLGSSGGAASQGSGMLTPISGGTPEALVAAPVRQPLSVPLPSQDTVTASRSGAVLGPFTILKEDMFPGMRSTKVPQLIEGAPNFRAFPSMPIFGTGMPTLDGIVGVLQAVSGSSSLRAGADVHALWVNMREEPVVYIRGVPFVLREEVRPLKNMLEYAGIDAARLEGMEDRLKHDVLAEAAKFNGRILLAYETSQDAAGTTAGELRDRWVEVREHEVLTPKEAYASLADAGYTVRYMRIPVTDGTAPSLDDYDAMVTAIMDWGLKNPVIFNCQLGIGRTTTGMVVSGLIHMYCAGMQLDHEASGIDNAALQGYLAGIGGLSPRSDEEEEEQQAYGTAGMGGDDDEHTTRRLWDMEPEELEEHRLLAAGGYVAVRRLERLLEEGESAKKTLDSVIDLASDVINLRVAIMRYRKPRSSYKFIRPEMQQRHAAFKRGSAYLERYCQLLAFTYYLEHVGAETMAFSQWILSRPDLQACMQFITDNPGASLQPLPIPKISLYQEADGAEHVDQRLVLSRRKGRCLSKRTILKSYRPTPPPLSAALLHAAHATHNPLLHHTPLPSAKPPATHTLALPLSRLSLVSEQHPPSDLVSGLNGLGLQAQLRDQLSSTAAAHGVCAADLPSEEGNLRATAHGPLPSVRRADAYPVYTVGNEPLDALAALLMHLVKSHQPSSCGEAEQESPDLDALSLDPALVAPASHPLGPVHVIVCDLREEMVVYVNGMPYIRRELEMPAASLHHAGVAAGQLEELERLLKEDVADEAALWGGRILLHREVNPHAGAKGTSSVRGRTRAQSAPGGPEGATPAPPVPSVRGVSPAAIVTRAPPQESCPPITCSPHASLPSTPEAPAPGTASSPLAPQSTPLTHPLHPLHVTPGACPGTGASCVSFAASAMSSLPPTPGEHTGDSSTPIPRSGQPVMEQGGMAGVSPASAAPSGVSRGARDEDMTALVDVNPGLAVEAFWESVEGSSSEALMTPLEVAQLLRARGFPISYRRIPLSRERTPEAADMDALYKHFSRVSDIYGQPQSGGSSGGTSPARTVYLILSRTPTSSSPRFVAAAACTYIMAQQEYAAARDTQLRASSEGSAPSEGGSPTHSTGSLTPTFMGLRSRRATSKTAISALSAFSPTPSMGGAAQLDGAAGEYRGIMSLCRLLRGGFEAKLAVDQAIAACSPVGDLLADISRCKQQAAAAPESPLAPGAVGQSVQNAARQLGIHYLKRYFLLVTFRCYLDQHAATLASSSVYANLLAAHHTRRSFAAWVHDQPELHHLALHLTLDL